MRLSAGNYWNVKFPKIGEVEFYSHEFRVSFDLHMTTLMREKIIVFTDGLLSWYFDTTAIFFLSKSLSIFHAYDYTIDVFCRLENSWDLAVIWYFRRAEGSFSVQSSFFSPCSRFSRNIGYTVWLVLWIIDTCVIRKFLMHVNFHKVRCMQKQCRLLHLQCD